MTSDRGQRKDTWASTMSGIFLLRPQQLSQSNKKRHPNIRPALLLFSYLYAVSQTSVDTLGLPSPAKLLIDVDTAVGTPRGGDLTWTPKEPLAQIPFTGRTRDQPWWHTVCAGRMQIWRLNPAKYFWLWKALIILQRLGTASASP